MKTDEQIIQEFEKYVHKHTAIGRLDEEEIKDFASLYGFNRVTCQCPVGQNSMRKTTQSLIEELQKLFKKWQP